MPQMSMFTRASARRVSRLAEEIIVDSFAGGGGVSKGIESGLGRDVDVAINHDRAAIEMHQANHPDTIHLHRDVFKGWKTLVKTVGDLRRLGRAGVGLFWLSPDCRDFSRAKGGTPVRKKIRGLAWVGVRAARQLQPRVIILENVREFEQWGPLQHIFLEGVERTAHEKLTCPLKGRARAKWLEGYQYDEYWQPSMMPNPAKRGFTFKRFVRMLRKAGYEVQWRVLNAADYGAPTHRRRLFLIARRDGQPIRWPRPAHGPGRRHPYRTAGECIDWSLPCHSIFMSTQDVRDAGLNINRPLKPKSLRRIARGIVRYVINSKKPYIVRTGHWSNKTGAGSGFRGQSLDKPLGAVCGTNDKALVLPWLVKYYSTGGQAQVADAPLHTVTDRMRFSVVTPVAVKVNHGGADEFRGQPLDQPLHTQTGHHGTGVAAPVLFGTFGRSPEPAPTDEPSRTVMPKDGPAVAAAAIVGVGGPARGAEERPADQPFPAVQPKDARAAVAANLVQYNQEKGAEVRGGDPAKPLNVIPTENRHGSVLSFLYRIGQWGSNGGCVNAATDPLTTVVSKQEHSAVEVDVTPAEAASFLLKLRGSGGAKPCDKPLDTAVAGATTFGPVVAHLVQWFGGMVGKSLDVPCPAVTSVDHNGIATASLAEAAHVIQYFGDRVGKPADEPLPTITGDDHNAVAAVHLFKGKGDSCGTPASDPCPTITSGAGAARPAGCAHSLGAVAAALVHFNHGQKQWNAVDEPLRAITSNNHAAVLEAELAQLMSPPIWAAFNRVYAFLLEYFGPEAPLPIVEIDGVPYLIVDIGMRMLTPRELARCQGFPEDYILSGSNEQQVRKIGNSVPPVLPKVLVRANCRDMAVPALRNRWAHKRKVRGGR